MKKIDFTWSQLWLICLTKELRELQTRLTNPVLAAAFAKAISRLQSCKVTQSCNKSFTVSSYLRQDWCNFKIDC
jgi:hypothetical protein